MKNSVFGMTKVLYAFNASCSHPTQYFAISQKKVPRFDLMSSLNAGINTSPQNRFLNRCVYKSVRGNFSKHFLHLKNNFTLLKRARLLLFELLKRHTF